MDIWLVPELVEIFKEKLGVDNELDSVEQLENYPWPNPDDYDYETAAAKAKELAKEFVALGTWISLFEVYCSMRLIRSSMSVRAWTAKRSRQSTAIS